MKANRSLAFSKPGAFRTSGKWWQGQNKWCQAPPAAASSVGGITGVTAGWDHDDRESGGEWGKGSLRSPDWWGLRGNHQQHEKSHLTQCSAGLSCLFSMYISMEGRKRRDGRTWGEEETRRGRLVTHRVPVRHLTQLMEAPWPRQYCVFSI